jgi:DNA adenine methylase
MRYPGGKGKTYQHLINLMPPHEVYIETHLGGGAVLRNKRPASRNIAIDLDLRPLQAWTPVPRLDVELVHGRAEDYLAVFQFSGEELVFCDPPFHPSTRRRKNVYTFDYTVEDHERLLALLMNLPCKVMLSGYDNPLYDSTLAVWNQHTFAAKTHTGLRQETVWFNFEPPHHLHDSRYIGSNFRDRQCAKRRMQRLQNKFASMDPVERAAFMQWLHEAYAPQLETS